MEGQMDKVISNEKRFIEVTFPIKEVSKESSKERNIRGGHISTLHLWWSRKPLSSSRATTYAALIPYPLTENEVKEKTEFIIELSKWKNSLRGDVIEKAREDILKANGGKPLKVLDPFAGGGSIPLECFRLGLEPHAGEYNPVAVLILKCTLEYPQRYGRQNKVKRDEGLLNIEKKENALISDVRKWGEWVLEQARKEIGKFYPEDEDGSIPLGYYWMRTIPCQNPSCGAEIPLTSNWWLARKKDKKVFLYPFVYNGKIEFAIVQKNKDEWQVVESSVPGFIPKVSSNFVPENGTVSRAFVVCPVCKSTIEDNQVRKLFQEEKAGQRMVVVVLSKSGKKAYRLATERDIDLYRNAKDYLEIKRKKLLEEWGFDPVPDEDFFTSEVFSARLYKFTKFGDLFNARQKLALIVFTEKVRLAYEKMIEEGYDEEYAKVVLTYLGLGVSRIAEYMSNLCIHDIASERTAHVFGRQSLHMVWDYSEVNPLSKAVGSWTSMVLRRILLSLSHLTKIPPMEDAMPVVFRSSATELPYPDNYFDAVFTDPPYYDNIPYSYLSDFFYVWLKRSIGNLYPDLFSTLLTPKSEEIVAYSKQEGGSKSGKKRFEEMLRKAFQEIYRVLKPNGIAVIIYTHKSTSGWETMINAFLDSGLVPTASLPIGTEMKNRLTAKKTAALSSSIHIVCRKMEKDGTRRFSEVKEETREKIFNNDFLENGFVGPDFLAACIGLATSVFARYEKVIDDDGSIVRADKLLKFVREVTTDYMVKHTLYGEIAEKISPLTKFYVLWRQTFRNTKVKLDKAQNLAQSVGIDLLDENWGKGFIKKENGYVKVLGPQKRKIEEIESLKNKDLIDVLHLVLLLWSQGKMDGIKEILVENGFTNNETFYKVAQAISETLSSSNKEKRLIDSFLPIKDKLLMEINKTGGFQNE
jgi:adenine-specific DNA methylase